MTKKPHPLTDEMIQEIGRSVGGCEFNDSCHDEMRAAYDLAIKHVKNEIELQLESISGEWRLDQYETSIAIENFGKKLIQTMHPQQQEGNW